MADKRSILIEIVGDASKLQRELKQAEKDAGSFAGSMVSTGKKMQDVGGSLTKGLTLPLAAVGAGAIAASTQFNSAMANVATLIPGNTKRVGELKGSVQDLAIQTGKSTGDLSAGLYETVSAFGDSADAVKILEINAKAARGGMAETGEAIALTSAVTKGYGDTSAEAVGKAADLALMTVRLGQTTFPELASSIGRVTPLASELNVTQEELFGTMATFTGVTGGAAEVSTQLRGVLQSLMAPTADMRALMDEYGVATGGAFIEQEGLQGAMAAVVAKAEESGKPLQSYMGSIEGQTLALAAAGGQADAYTEKTGAMNDALGTNDEAFKESTEGVNKAGFEMEQAQQKAAAMAQDLGDALGPALIDVLEAAEPLIDGVGNLVARFGELDESTRGWIVASLGLVAALGPALVITGTFLRSAGEIAKAYGHASEAAKNGISWVRDWSAAVRASRNDGASLSQALSAGLNPAMLGIGALLVTGAVVLKAWHREKQEAKRRTDEFVRAIEADNGVLAENTRAVVENELVHSGLAATLRDYGIDLADVVDASLGEAEAHERVEAALVAKREELGGNTREAYDFLFGAARDARDFINEEAAAVAAAAEQTELLGETKRVAVEASDSWARSLERTRPEIEGTTEAVEGATGAVDELTDAQKILEEGLKSFSKPATDYTDLVKIMEDRQRDAAEGMAEAAGKGKSSWRDFVTDVKVSLGDYATELEAKTENARNWQRNLTIVAGRAGIEVAQELAKMGADGVGLVAEFANGTDAEVRRAATALMDQAHLGSQGAARELDLGMQVAEANVRAGGKATVAELAAQLGVGEAEVRAAAIRYNVALDDEMTELARIAGAGGEEAARQIRIKLREGGQPFVNTAAGYGTGLANALNPVITSTGGKPIPPPGQVAFYAEGGREDHTAHFTRTLRVFGEPETGGEWYIPAAPAKRQRSTKVLSEAAQEFGYQLVPFAEGGFYDESDVPRPPTFAPYRPPIQTAGQSGARYAYDAAVDFVKRAVPQLQGGGWRALVDYLRKTGVPHRVTDTVRPAGTRTASGGISLHSLGLAADFAGPVPSRDSPALAAIFKAFQPIEGQLRELIYAGPQVSYNIKNGRRVAKYAQALHHDHVHGATYDDGGELLPGLTFARNDTGQAERVTGPGQHDELIRELQGLRRDIRQLEHGHPIEIDGDRVGRVLTEQIHQRSGASGGW